MATVDLAAASLGAAAPVPPAQAPTPPGPSGFADVLAGCTGEEGCDIPATDTRQTLDAAGERTWDALTRIARRFAVSPTIPTPALGDPKAARAVEAGPVAATGSDPGDEDMEHGTGTTVCVVPEAFLFVPMPEARTSPVPEGPRSEAGTTGETPSGDAATAVAESGPAVVDPLAGDDQHASPPGTWPPEAMAAAAGATAVEAAAPETTSPAGSDRVPAAPPSAAKPREQPEATAASAAASAIAEPAATVGTGPTVEQPAERRTDEPAAPPGRTEAIDAGGRSDRAIRQDRPSTAAARAILERFRAAESQADTRPDVRPAARTFETMPARVREKADTLAPPAPRFDVPGPSTMPTAGIGASAATGIRAPLDVENRLESQIVQALRMQWGQHGGEATIRLQPHYLGDLTISLHVENGGVSARLVASSAEVRQWIEANEATLRQSLAQHHLSLEHLIVLEEEPSSGAGHPEGREREPADDRRRPPRRRERDATFEVVV